jgi:hypothetical protein
LYGVLGRLKLNNERESEEPQLPNDQPPYMEEDGRLEVKISGCGTHVTGKILFPPSPNLIGLFSLLGNHPKIVARLGKTSFYLQYLDYDQVHFPYIHIEYIEYEDSRFPRSPRLNTRGDSIVTYPPTQPQAFDIQCHSMLHFFYLTSNLLIDCINGARAEFRLVSPCGTIPTCIRRPRWIDDLGGAASYPTWWTGQAAFSKFS